MKKNFSVSVSATLMARFEAMLSEYMADLDCPISSKELDDAASTLEALQDMGADLVSNAA